MYIYILIAAFQSSTCPSLSFIFITTRKYIGYNFINEPGQMHERHYPSGITKLIYNIHTRHCISIIVHSHYFKAQLNCLESYSVDIHVRGVVVVKKLYSNFKCIRCFRCQNHFLSCNMGLCQGDGSFLLNI